MFPQIKANLFLVLILLSGFVLEDANAQYSRGNLLRQAQQRGTQNSNNLRGVQRRQPQPRIAQGSNSRVIENSPIANSSPIPQSNTPVNSQGAPVVGGPAGSHSGGYVPQHLQMSSPVISDNYVDSGAPIVDNGYITEGLSGGCGENGCGGGCDSGCGGCGVGKNYFNNCCNRSGGCGPNAWDQCWFGALGRLFSNAEIFGGAHGFRSQNFTAGTQPVDDSSFGFYGGVNLGMPLCRLACGLFSGQIGIRSSQSEFEGDFFSVDNRDQLFVTAGIFRRVDYGLQLGLVGDFLHEEWFAETDLTQIRGDIGWVYPGGNTIGFRFASGTDDDNTNGIINGVAFTNLFAEVVDNYRFYYRMMSNNGGHCDAFAGWSDADHAVLGLAFDMPVASCWGMQSGFTYFLPEDTAPTVPVSTQDAWNLYIGFSLRPQGSRWYGNYDRPLFDVADNGTFVFSRN